MKLNKIFTLFWETTKVFSLVSKRKLNIKPKYIGTFLTLIVDIILCFFFTTWRVLLNILKFTSVILPKSLWHWIVIFTTISKKIKYYLQQVNTKTQWYSRSNLDYIMKLIKILIVFCGTIKVMWLASKRKLNIKP